MGPPVACEPPAGRQNDCSIRREHCGRSEHRVKCRVHPPLSELRALQTFCVQCDEPIYTGLHGGCCAGYSNAAAEVDSDLASYNAVAGVRSAVSMTAMSVMKVANEFQVAGDLRRQMHDDPDSRCNSGAKFCWCNAGGSSYSGLGKISIPAPEPGPGSGHYVPGPTTPQQVENLSMVAAQVITAPPVSPASLDVAQLFWTAC